MMKMQLLWQKILKTKLQFFGDYWFYLTLIISFGVLIFAKTWLNLSINLTFNWWQILQFVVLYPLFEEIIFRGWLQNYLLSFASFSQKIFKISGANLCTSVIFASLHLFNQSLFIVFGVFLSSLVFGFFYEKYQTIVVAFTLHSLFNLMLLIF